MSSSRTITFTDKFFAATILRFLPRTISPNQLTIARFIMTPFVAYTLFTDMYKLGFLVFGLAALTDALDGARARTEDRITRWGEFWDPVADKLLVGIAAIIIFPRFLDPLLLLGVVIGELVPVGALLVSKYRLQTSDLDISANLWGKLKMVFQCVALLFVLFHAAVDGLGSLWIPYYLFVIAIALSLVSAIAHYLNWQRQ